MHRFGNLSIAALAAVLSVTALAESKKKEVSRPVADQSFPETYLSQIEKGERFKNPDYFRILAGDGIRSADQRGLFHRISVAVNDGKNYKALYLARLFTTLKPDSAEGWANRASIAATLGIADESAACQANSEHPENAKPVLLGILPGKGLQVRPKDTYDWAAAIALIADGLAAAVGQNNLASVRDDVSGIHVSTAQELAQLNADLANNGLPLSGPWAVSEPLLTKDVLPNLFSLVSGSPMQEKNTNKGSLIGAMVMGGLAGMQRDAATAAQAAQASGAMMEQAFSIPSKYSGGSYVGATFTGAIPEQKVFQPRPSGESRAVGGPVPLLWASGSSLSPTVYCQIISTDNLITHHISPEDLKKPNAKRKFYHEHLPALHYPRLAEVRYHKQLDSDEFETSIPLTLFEMMLSGSDLREMFPNLTLMSFDWTEDNVHYQRGDLIILPVNGKAGIVGYDDKGIVYTGHLGPTAWLMRPGK